jgi:hypothetical protein
MTSPSREVTNSPIGGIALALGPTEARMDNERDPRSENEEIGQTNEEGVTGASDEEEFEDIEEIETDEEDLES